MWIFRIVCLFVVQEFIFLPQSLAQSAFSYQSAQYQASNEVELNKILESAYKNSIAVLPKDYRGELKKIYQKKYDGLIKDLKEAHFIFDSPLNQYVNHVLAQIIRANPSLSRQEIRLLVSRHSDPNASCVGDGTLIINIGLTRRFENESQLAFVICHELAHLQLNHVNQSIQQYVEKLYGRSTQREISRITSGDNRRVEKATELLRGILYESSRHSRVNEAAADSLAVILMKNTPYDELESLKVLALLDTVDTEKYRFPLQLKQSLDSPQYPFKDNWLQASSLLKLEPKKSEDWDKDSLKTHPDCDIRIKKVKELLPKAPPTTKKLAFVQPESLFSEMVTRSDFELVEREYQFKKYDKCLLNSLLLIRKFPDSPYLHATIGKCFYRLYEAQKNHELGKYVSMPAPEQSTAYREVIDFIHNLRLSDLPKIGYYYLKKHQLTSSSDEGLLYVLARLSKAVNVGEETKTLKNEYLRLFPKGQYLEEIKQL